MSDTAGWQKNNEAYLAAALRWLRLRLTRLAEGHPAPSSAVADEPVESSGWWIFKRRSQTTPSPSTLAIPARAHKVTDADVTRAVAEMSAFESQEPPPALMILSDRLGLSRFEAQVLLLCAATELDTRIAGLCARAQDDANRPYPTFALALALLDEPAWDALSPQSPLRDLRLIEINQPLAQPLTTSALRADERVVSYIKGLNYLDDRLAPRLAPMEMSAVSLPVSQQGVVESILHYVQLASRLQRPPVLQLTGLDLGSKQLIAARVAAGLGLQLYRLPVETLPTQAAELETFARLWEREARLLPIVLYLDAHEAGAASPTEGELQPAAPLNRFLARSHGLFFLDTRDVWPGLGETAGVFDIATPAPAEQFAAWQAALGAAAGNSPTLLAGQFNLNVTTIQRIAQTALTETGANSAPLSDRLWQLCLISTRPRLELLAQRLQPKATWDDIVLPGESVALLHHIADQVRQRIKVYEDWGFRQKMNRGLGISALFTGESGTGKTMAAEVIANDLRLDLYRIDLSAVVSKYIGETEKNLRRLFDAAEDGGAILFFDEADALFGKRSEVKDSHDRYANIEINYLLQRMEAYRGLAILATNMKNALDTAFMRRLRFIINVPFPSLAERKVIWQKVFPAQTPTSALDFDRLARFNITGGSIHKIAINAAFLAAKRSSQVTMSHILEATRIELHQLERPINEGDFVWRAPNGGAK